MVELYTNILIRVNTKSQIGKRGKKTRANLEKSIEEGKVRNGGGRGGGGRSKKEEEVEDRWSERSQSFV